MWLFSFECRNTRPSCSCHITGMPHSTRRTCDRKQRPELLTLSRARASPKSCQNGVRPPSAVAIMNVMISPTAAAIAALWQPLWDSFRTVLFFAAALGVVVRQVLAAGRTKRARARLVAHFQIELQDEIAQEDRWPAGAVQVDVDERGLPRASVVCSCRCSRRTLPEPPRSLFDSIFAPDATIGSSLGMLRKCRNPLTLLVRGFLCDVGDTGIEPRTSSV
jgi:hypothetical protein